MFVSEDETVIVVVVLVAMLLLSADAFACFIAQWCRGQSIGGLSKLSMWNSQKKVKYVEHQTTC
jgi:hypothetical protein